jgi:hypothetical protein
MVLGWRCGSSTGFVHALQSTKPGVQTLAPTQKKKKVLLLKVKVEKIKTTNQLYVYIWYVSGKSSALSTAAKTKSIF